MKIVWMSDSPSTSTGYGNATRFICAGLAKQGHRISIIGWQKRGLPQRWSNCRLLPIGENPFGADVLLSYLRRIRPDVLVTQGDWWRLTYIANPAISGFLRVARIPWTLYYTIDSDRGNGALPPSLVHLLDAVDLPIAASRYGREIGITNGLAPAYIPYGVDTRVFRPPHSKAAAKRAFGYQDRFVVLSDARNQQRKLWPRTLEIFRRFAEGKDDVLLHIHCDPNDPSARTNEYNYNLRADIKFLKLTKKVRFTDALQIDVGIPLKQLGAIYQAADVHLLSSYGEGFGLPSLQAAATGVVPFASDYSASRELVEGHGEPIRVRRFVKDQFGMRCAMVDIDDAVGKLERLYRDRTLLKKKSDACTRFAAAYDWNEIVLRWHDLLRSKVPALRRAFMRNSRQPDRRVSRTRAGPVARLKTRSPSLPKSNLRLIAKLERIGGHLSAEIVRDMSRFETIFTLPVTPSPVSKSKIRVVGRIYLAGERDLMVFVKLKRIFPGLTAWSSVDLTSKNVRSLPLSIISNRRNQYRSYLATSTLALNVGGTDSALSDQAAAGGVPCIGLASLEKQLWLWPSLSLETSDVHQAATLGRWMLTDHADAAEVCSFAQKRWRKRYAG